MKVPGLDLGVNIAKEVAEFKALLTSIVAKLDTLIEIEERKTHPYGCPECHAYTGHDDDCSRRVRR